MGYRAKVQPKSDESVSLFPFRGKEYNIENIYIENRRVERWKILFCI
jgi:hypothetical protein